MDDLLVGLDVGTSSVKAVALTSDGVERAAASAPVTWTVSGERTELDAYALVASVTAALGDLLVQVPGRRVSALGVASMAESGVLLDRAGEPLGPLVAWHDRRDVALVPQLDRALGEGRFSSRTGLPLWPQWSLTKHRWLLDHAGVGAAVRRLDVAAWVVRALGGDEGSELSLASRTGWLDLRARAWWDEALAWSGGDRALLAPLVEAGTPLGTAGTTVPGLAGAVLTVAGHDHQAAVVGVGATGPGAELDSCGSAEALVRTVSPDLPDAAVRELAGAGTTVGWHALAGSWCLLGGTQGGLALRGVLTVLGRTQADVPALDAEAMALTCTSVRLDLADPTRPVVLEGAGRPEAEVWRAALDTVTAEAAAVRGRMTAVAGEPTRTVAAGGWSRSTGLMERKRALLGPLETSPVREPGARGAALLAGVAGGVYASTDDLPPVPS
ncbi:sugar (pentulose or hexulose) kinase [Motilibacter peucedani]|uniref:Sugar (Pentulose or hexulose) kinase n=1 Tax=Motilibacter peucedani TaxID=598650 RepID=A0A420XQF5_9ACTN|nr:FGGY family carbohydrate kinase [Motilibacter peucedani]RKS75489.1 sugar (pentulose or hexulose) kinase [Motilibacter peucedani]